jgi:two-component system nitrogen regulation response regulator GlnG
MAHLLIVDDEQSICWGLSRLAKKLGHTAEVASSAEQGLDLSRRQAPDAIVLDIRLPGMDGLTAMDRFRQELGPVPIIIITAFGELATAVEAVRKGAFEYLVKPFELHVAERAIRRALEAPGERPDSNAPANARDAEQRIVGSSAAIQGVFKRIAVVAPTEACVHLRGESGTGKELVARAIHRYSRRAAGPFVAVNVASLSPSLAESELFGHVRGAFTGAEQGRRGLLEQAHGGTIFFDEVADIPLSIQVKLLRVLEYGEILPVGGERPVSSQFRVISATHQDLCRRVAEGAFREDLYFRLITFEIEIPPLRERASDVRELVEHFLKRLAEKNGCAAAGIAHQTIAALEGRPWHGNVRELRNALEHAMILARGGTILPEHLPSPTPPANGPGSAREAMLAALVRDWARAQLDRSPEATDLYERLLRVVEPPLLDAVLQRHRGQFAAAARQLGLHRVTLKKKADEYKRVRE